MAQRINPDYIPRGLNRYVSGEAYVGDLHRGGTARVNLGAPAALSATGLFSALANGTANAGTITAPTNAAYDTVAGLSRRYGRNLTMVCSSAGTNVIRMRGYDWLGQAMREDFTLNGTTTVQGNKAFKFVTSAEIVTGTGSTTVNIGYGDRLGLPFKAKKVMCSWETGVE